ncbi:unnamed protein product [Urochloa humidicola]
MARRGGSKGSGSLVLLGLAMMLLGVAASSSAAMPLEKEAKNYTALVGGPGALGVDFYALSCPDLEGMVRFAVQEARSAWPDGVQVTAGLLRIFFHDCFPQGCDASILLDGWNSERKIEPQNQGLNKRALDLIETIRDRVHKKCGATSVSCADILALATKHAVHLAGGPWISIPLGRRDSLDPAPRETVTDSLPRPDADVTTLINKFREKGLGGDDQGRPTDLVALSGAHTVGKARCRSFGDRTSRPDPNDAFVNSLARFCANSGDGSRQHSLDVITPDSFDNGYFVDLRNRQGVLTSDQGLYADGRTKWLVDGFADNPGWFQWQFAQSMIKMSRLGLGAPGGEVRANCFSRNTIHQTANQDEGLAASA